jgi:type VI secretion system protein VasI
MRTCFTITLLLALIVFLTGLAVDQQTRHARTSPHREASKIETGSVGPGTQGASTAWAVDQASSPINDMTNVDLSVSSEHPVPAKFGGALRLKLAIRCREGKTSLAVHFGDHFMTSSKYGDWGKVTYRVDRRAAAEALWVHSPDNAELVIQGPPAIELATSMVSASNFLIRAVPFGEMPLTASFDVSGLENAIAPLRTACAW